MHNLLYMILIIYIYNKNSHIYAFKGQNTSACRDFADTSSSSPVRSTASPPRPKHMLFNREPSPANQMHPSFSAHDWLKGEGPWK